MKSILYDKVNCHYECFDGKRVCTSVCMATNRLHFFLLLEDDENNKTAALSFVPVNRPHGYNPFSKPSECELVNSLELGIESFVILKRKEMNEFRLKYASDAYSYHLLLPFIGFCGTHNCLTYSLSYLKL